MDIYNYLKKDHRLVAEMMEQVVESKDAAERLTLLDNIKLELTLHAKTEEETFYKAVEKASRAKPVHEVMEEAHHEHDEIETYLEKLSTLDVNDELWIETFGEFKHAVSHHVEEEEERIFEKAKKYLSGDDAKKLAQEMDMLKKKQRPELMNAMQPADV